MQEAIATLGAAGKVDDMDLDEVETADKKAKKAKKKRAAEETEAGELGLHHVSMFPVCCSRACLDLLWQLLLATLRMT